MNVEEAPVEEGNLAKEGSQFGRTLGLGLAQPMVEELQQELAVELLKAAVAIPALDLAQLSVQVVGVAVQEALLLDEVDEHHTVEHEGGVPVAVALGRDALNELPEVLQFFLEAVVEALGDLLDVEGFDRTRRDIANADAAGLILQGEDEAVEALQQGLAGLACVEPVLPAGGGLSGLTLDPLPDLLRTGCVHKDDEVLERPLDDLGLDLAPHRVRRYRAVGTRGALEDGETRFLRHGFERVLVAVNGQSQRLALKVVPTQSLDEERLKVESL